LGYQYDDESIVISEIQVNGAEVQGGIGQAGERDTYQFVATAAGEYLIETSGSTDVYLTLFGPNDQTTIITEDDDSGSGRNSRISRGLTPGAYYVRVRHYSPARTGNYGIRVDLVAAILEVQGEIGRSGEFDYYRINVAAAGENTIETSGSTDVYLTLFGPNDQTTIIEQDDDSGPGRNSRIVRALTPGIYYASVRHYSPTQTGSYGIRVNSVAAISEIQLNGAELQGEIGQAGESDTYRFNAAEAGEYTIETSGSTDVYLTLFGPNDQTIAIAQDDDSDPGLNSRITRALAPGIYYASVRHYSSTRTGSYGIGVKSVAAISEIQVNGAEARGGIGQAGESDTYRFMAATAGEYTIETSGSTDVYLTLFGPNDQTITIAQDDDSGPGLNSRITRTLAPGTYYASVRHYSSTRTGNYGIGVRRN
jgi:hypothetical protein